MAKKNRKQYTAEQKYQYHKKRMNDKSVSENKRIYSMYWVRGFSDPHADTNLKASQSQYKREKKYFKRSDYAVFNGDMNGMKAAVKDKQAARKAMIEQHYS